MKRWISFLLALALLLQVPIGTMAVEPDHPTFRVETVVAEPGDSGIKVKILAENNPGIASAKLIVNYDDTTLKLTNVEYNAAWGGMSQPPQYLKNPLTLNWFNGTADFTQEDAVYVTLTFDVGENAAAGTSEIELSYNPDDVYNIAENNVDFHIVNGGITVKAAEVEPPTEPAPGTDPTFRVETKEAAPGDTSVKISIWAENNPGIASAKLIVNYDDAVLDLTKVEYNTAWGGMSQPPQYLKNPLTLNWFNGTADFTQEDAVYVTLTFDVGENAAAGTSEIELSYNPDDVYNIAENNVAFEIINGGIEIQTTATEPPTEPAPEDGPAFKVETKDATVGDTVKINIWAENNPGIASAKLIVNYDETALELAKVEYNTAWGGMSQPPQYLKNPLTLNWFNGTADFTEEDSIFATLTFNVLESAQVGMTEIELDYNPDDVYNIKETNLDFAIINGGVQISAGCNHTAVIDQAVAPTCTETGLTEGSHCSVCNEVLAKQEVVPALGHDYKSAVTEPDCTEQGYTTHTCTRCGHFYKDSYVPAKGHTWDEGVYKGDEKIYTCKVCGATKSESHEHSTELRNARPASCEEPGYTGDKVCTICGEVVEKGKTIPATGHTEVVDQAVAPTCTETGLTEGSHCSVCEKVLLPQEVIPATGHSLEQQGEQIICSVCDAKLALHIAQDYVLLDLQVINQVQLALEVSPAHLAEEVQWSIEGDENVISVTPDGTVTALNVGTAYAAATLVYEGFEIATRCRIDVTEEVQIAGIQLSTNKLTSELYSTDYAGVEIHLQLPQNNQFAAVDSQIPAEDMGIAIESARFEDAAMAELFEIRVMDDRNVIIVPTDYAVNNPKSVAGKYTGKVIVTVQGEEFTSENLTLTVKKTLPKLKATVPAFNSFYSGQSQQIVITGGTPTAVYEDASKNTAKATAIPNWLDLSEDGTLTLNGKAPLKSASAKAYLLVDTEEWRIPAAVTVSVKNTYKARGLKLSASAVTFTTDSANSNGVKLNLLATSKNEILADLKVTGITAPDGYVIENFNISDGSFILKTEAGFKAGIINLGVTFEDTDVAQPLKLTVKTTKITLKASSTKVTLNTGRNDSAVIDITATPADYQITDPVITLTGTELVNKKKVTVDKLNSGELDIGFEEGKLRIATTSKTPDKASYKLTISAGGSKAVTITINTVSANPTVTFKATGSMDLSFPNQAATITPTFKNCGNGFETFEYTVTEMKGKTVIKDITSAFEVTRDGNLVKVRCVDETVNISNTYMLKLKLILEDGNSVENTISLKVKRTAVKLKLSTTKLTLNKLIGDKAIVDVTCTTKGYVFTEPSIEVKDSKNKDATGQLNIAYDDGKLNIATNDATVYGTSYKVLVKANDYAPASTLTVTIPKADKSAVTATLKAAGSIDVIRDGSAITLTPSYKNVTAQTEKVETLVFYKTANKVTTEANDLFSYTVNPNGTITITKAKDAELDHSAKYTVKLVTAVNGQNVCESKSISISVKMGVTKLTLKANDAMLFAQDKHDRVAFSFNAADKTLNEVVKVEIKDAKYKDIFEVYDYGNGEFAIGFKDSNVSEKLIGKKATLAVTLNLNVFIEGNQTTKANTTAKIKLTIVK